MLQHVVDKLDVQVAFSISPEYFLGLVHLRSFGLDSMYITIKHEHVCRFLPMGALGHAKLSTSVTTLASAAAGGLIGGTMWLGGASRSRTFRKRSSHQDK